MSTVATTQSSRTVAQRSERAFSPRLFLTVLALGSLGIVSYVPFASAIGLPSMVTGLQVNGSLIAVGMLNLIVGYFFFRSHEKRWIMAVFVLASVGAIGAGVFPLGTGDLQGLFALLAFLFFNVEAIGSAVHLAGVMKVISVLAGLRGICFVVLMAIGDAGNTAVFGSIGHGGAERMIVYPPMLWMMAFGGYLMATPRTEAATSVSRS